MVVFKPGRIKQLGLVFQTGVAQQRYNRLPRPALLGEAHRTGEVDAGRKTEEQTFLTQELVNESPSFVSVLPLVNHDHMAAPNGSAQTVAIFELRSFKYIAVPASVPPVPTAETNAVISPFVCAQISGPVVR